MPVNDLLTPWFLLAAVLIPLVYIEKWIHSHLYGVGWLLTDDKKSATALYYVFLLPGVFLHEFIQWLVAGALNVKTKRVMAWPEAQNDGTLRLDFVRIEKPTWYQAAIIGAMPLIVGLGVIWTISNYVLDFENFLSALGAGDITLIGSSLQELTGKTDFFLWLYLMFAISNAMLPTPSDRAGWPLFFSLFGGTLIVVLVAGLNPAILKTLTGPVAHGLEILTTAFFIVLLIEIPEILFIGFFEEILERLTRRKFEYSTPVEAPKPREPGSNLPLPPDAPLPSIYNLLLPIPDPSIQESLKAKRTRLPAAVTTTAASSPPMARNQVLAQRSPARLSDSSPGSPLSPAPADDDQPVTLRPGGFQRPASSLRSPLSPTPKEDDEDDDDQPTRPPVTSRPGGFQRPASSLRSPLSPTPKDDDEDDDDQPTRRPVSSRPGGFQRPASSQRSPLSPTPKDDEDDDDQPTRSPVSSRPGGFQRPASSQRSPLSPTPKEDDDQPTRQPVTSRPGGLQRPASSLRSPLNPTPKNDDADDDDQPTRRPVSSRPGGFQRPTSSLRSPLSPTPKEDDADEDEDQPTHQPVTSRPGGFQRPASSLRSPLSPIPIDEDDEDEDEMYDDDIEYVDFDDV